MCHTTDRFPVYRLLVSLLEKAVHSQLYPYLEINDLLTAKQSGFTKGICLDEFCGRSPLEYGEWQAMWSRVLRSN